MNSESRSVSGMTMAWKPVNHRRRPGTGPAPPSPGSGSWSHRGNDRCLSFNDGAPQMSAPADSKTATVYADVESISGARTALADRLPGKRRRWDTTAQVRHELTQGPAQLRW